MPPTGSFYDGTQWQTITSMSFYDGTEWKLTTTGSFYDGTQWRVFHVFGGTVVDTSASLDSINATVITPASGSPGVCGTCSGCTSPGQCHKVGWKYSVCIDAIHHIATLRSTDGGGYVLVQNDISCDNDPGSDCDDHCTRTACDGRVAYFAAHHDAAPFTAVTYQYKVQIRADTGDAVLSVVTEGSAESENEADGVCIA
jgi:hypothetical protein